MRSASSRAGGAAGRGELQTSTPRQFPESAEAPHFRNFRKRVIESPKLHFHDTGLACHLLGIRQTEQLRTHPLHGALFENFVVAEVAKGRWHHRREPPIHFWRDRTGHEVDLVLEEATLLHPVEIKSGATVSADMLAGLAWWRRVAGSEAGRAFLVHGGTKSHERDGIGVRPWFAV